MPVRRTTSSESVVTSWVPAWPLPVTAKTLVPSEASPPCAQIPSEPPAVTQPANFVGSVMSMATTQPR